MSRGLSGERGSLPIAMLAMIVMAGLITVIVATVISGQRHTRFDTNYEKSLQIAEIGGDRLAHHIRFGDIPASVNELALPDSGWTDASGGRYRAEAVRVGGGWEVRGTGQVGDVTRVAQMDIGEMFLFPHGLFADRSAVLRGASSQVVSYEVDNPDGNNKGHVGSNGTVTTSPTCGTHDGKYSGDWESDDVEQGSGCDEEIAELHDVASDEALSFITAVTGSPPEPEADDWEGCDTVIDAPVSGAVTWEAGRYCAPNGLTFLSDANVSLSGASLDDPVEIYVVGAVRLQGAGGGGPRLNCPPGQCEPRKDPVLPTAAGALQIYSASEEPVTLGLRSILAAVIYAPRADCTVQNWVQFFGAMTCRTVSNPTGNFRMYVDEALLDLTQLGQSVWSEERPQ